MYLTHDLWASDTQEIIIPLEELSVRSQAIVAEVVFLKVVRLKHGTHAPIQDEVALAQKLSYLRKSIRGSHLAQRITPDRPVQRI